MKNLNRAGRIDGGWERDCPGDPADFELLAAPGAGLAAKGDH